METVLGWVRKAVPRQAADRLRPTYHLALAMLAAVVYRFPGKRLTVIGVTGTNGKSTTCNLLASILEADGHRIGLMTTVNFQIGDERWTNDTKMTSPGRFVIQRMLRRMVKAGCTHAIVEVSSHALHWRRVWGIPFDTAVMTNLTRDHLDLHGSMRRYRAAKGRLFRDLAGYRRKEGVKKSVVVNLDDPEAKYFSSFPADEKYGYTAKGATPPRSMTVLAAEKTNVVNAGSSFQLVVNGETAEVRLKLPGAFNISNALAAAAAAYAHGAEIPEIVTGLTSVAGVPGRMERVSAGQHFGIVVDYAHSPDAFQNVLTALRNATEGKVITVFGATGDRDQGKRPELGRIAAEQSDTLFLTEEDPGSEDPKDIIAEILPGVEKAGKRRGEYWVIPDRREAISRALSVARAKDTVVLLGKGHETVMTYRDGKRPWDDRQVAAEEWRKLSGQA